MPLYALEDLGDALAATRSLLWPVGIRSWLRLAVVVLFVGGFGGNVSPVSSGVGGGDGAGPPPAVVPDESIVTVVLAVALAVAALGFVFLVVAGVMEFVFVESLRSREVWIRRYWRRRWIQGVRLALFRVALGLVTLLFLGGLLAVGLLPLVAGDAGPAAALALVVLVPAFVVVVLLAALVDGFTRAFVVPVMVVADCNVVAGWRRLWPTVTANPGQYLAYVVVAVLLSLVVGFAVGLLAAVVAALALVPFSIPFFAGAVLLDGAPGLGVAVLGVTGIAYGLVVAGALAVVRVPFATYVRYFELLVLGDVAPDLDPVPEVRESIRETERGGDAGTTG